MSIQQAVDFAKQAGETLGAVAVGIGAVGSLLEAAGGALKRPGLVAFGQRLEALGVDLPKLVRGSRLTAAQKL